MNPALLFLQWTRFRRKASRFLLSLRRPGTFLGAAALGTLGGALVYVSDDPAFDRLFRAGSMAAVLSLWLVASLLRGFMRRGLHFGPCDIEFLIPGPFSTRELVVFRLLPAYLSSLLSSLVFFALFKRRFTNPASITADFMLFQILCAHLTIAAALFAGRLGVRKFVQVRRAILIFLAIAGAISLNAALPVGFLPEVLENGLGRIGRRLATPPVDLLNWAFAHSLASAIALGAMVIVCWLHVLWSKADLREASVSHSETAHKTGPQAGSAPAQVTQDDRSAGKITRPPWPIFYGARVIVWKHLLTAFRTRRELLYASLVAVAYVGAVKIALDADLIDFARAMKSGGVSVQEHSYWNLLAATSAIIWIGFLGLILQRALPFDFRPDGHRIADLRVLPLSPVSVALMELAVPVLFTLSFQAAAISFFWVIGKFPSSMIWLSLLAFAVINAGLAGAGNIYFLVFAAKTESSQAGGILGAFLLMALSLGALAPGILTYLRLAGSTPALAALLWGMAVQLLVDGLLILALARVFRTCELCCENGS